MGGCTPCRWEVGRQGEEPQWFWVHTLAVPLLAGPPGTSDFASLSLGVFTFKMGPYCRAWGAEPQRLARPPQRELSRGALRDKTNNDIELLSDCPWTGLREPGSGRPEAESLEGSALGRAVGTASRDPTFQGMGGTGSSSNSALIEHRLNTGSGSSEQGGPAVWLAEAHCHWDAESPGRPGQKQVQLASFEQAWRAGVGRWPRSTSSSPPFLLPLSSLVSWDRGGGRKPPAPLSAQVPTLLSEASDTFHSRFSENLMG